MILNKFLNVLSFFGLSMSYMLYHFYDRDFKDTVVSIGIWGIFCIIVNIRMLKDKR